jgi:hypothetical protein
MPKTGEFKFWNRDFLSFLSIQAAALIPQLDMSSSGVPLNPLAQRYAHAMLVQCCRHSNRAAHAIAGVSAGRGGGVVGCEFSRSLVEECV